MTTTTARTQDRDKIDLYGLQTDSSIGPLQSYKEWRSTPTSTCPLPNHKTFIQLQSTSTLNFPI